MEITIQEAAQLYFERNWSRSVSQFNSYLVTMSFKAGALWERRRNKELKQQQTDGQGN